MTKPNTVQDNLQEAIHAGEITAIHPLSAFVDIPLLAPSPLTQDVIARMRAKASQSHLQTAGLVALAE